LPNAKQASALKQQDDQPKKFLGLPPSEPDTYDGPWERAEHWVVWLTLFWICLCLFGTLLAFSTNSDFVANMLAPPGEEIWFRLSRQLPVTFLIYIVFGLLVERLGVNVAYTRKTFHILGTFAFPLFFTPAVIEGVELYRQWYLSMTWFSLISFVLPYAIMVRPIRSRVRFLYLGHRCFDRPEDRPYTLIWFISQMLAVSVVLVPMTQYFAAKGMWSLYLIAAMANGLGDGLAEPIGKIWGKKKYKVRALFTRREYTRSYAGSACVAFFTAIGVLLNQSILSTGELITLLAILPALLAFIEAKSPHTWDNVFMYIACWVVIYFVVLA
jgi:hypothetical protein